MTEKNYNPEQMKSNKKVSNTDKTLKKKKEAIKDKPEEPKIINQDTITKENKEQIEEVEKKEKQKKERKTEARINAKDVPVSTKYAASICRFIRKKRIENAIKDLEQVLLHKKFIPVKGEIPHRKGAGKIASGAGRYINGTTKKFIILLKSLSANSSQNGLENPIISEAISNKAQRPYGRFGAVRRKRTHITLIARERNPKKN